MQINFRNKISPSICIESYHQQQVKLVSQTEGKHVYIGLPFLCRVSDFLTRLVVDCHQWCNSPLIIVPVSTDIIQKLVNMLLHGICRVKSIKELANIQVAAKFLGVDMSQWEAIKTDEDFKPAKDNGPVREKTNEDAVQCKGFICDEATHANSADDKITSISKPSMNVTISENILVYCDFCLSTRIRINDYIEHCLNRHRNKVRDITIECSFCSVKVHHLLLHHHVKLKHSSELDKNNFKYHDTEEKEAKLCGEENYSSINCTNHHENIDFKHYDGERYLSSNSTCQGKEDSIHNQDYADTYPSLRCSNQGIANSCSDILEADLQLSESDSETDEAVVQDLTSRKSDINENLKFTSNCFEEINQTIGNESVRTEVTFQQLAKESVSLCYLKGVHINDRAVISKHVDCAFCMVRVTQHHYVEHCRTFHKDKFEDIKVKCSICSLSLHCLNLDYHKAHRHGVQNYVTRDKKSDSIKSQDGNSLKFKEKTMCNFLKSEAQSVNEVAVNDGLFSDAGLINIESEDKIMECPICLKQLQSSNLSFHIIDAHGDQKESVKSTKLHLTAALEKSTSRSAKNRTNPSDIAQYFEEVEDRTQIKCLICNNVVSKGNKSRHFKRHV